MDQIRSHRFFSYYQYSDNIQLLKNSSDVTPSISSTAPDNGKVSLSWSVPKGGHPITSYKIYVYNSNNEIENTIPIQDIQTTSYTIQGLSNNVNYRFKVASVIRGEKELSSEEKSSTPFIQATAPSAPQITSAKAGNTEVSLEWSEPLNGGSPITSYKIYVYDSSGQELTNKNVSGITTLSTSVSGLDNGTTYTFKVSAFNEIDESEKSLEVSSMPFSAPSAPTITSAESGNASVLLRWSAPSDNGGYPITSYNVYVYSSTGSLLDTIQISDIQTTSTTVSGLTNGTTYKFKVSAVNQIGQTYSNEVSSMPATVPSAPTITSNNAGNTSVSLQWSDPSNNGSTITSYKIYVYSSTDVSLNTITGIATRSSSVTGLTNGTTYKFRVSALNAKGESLRSTSVSSTPVAPATSPSAPTITSATSGIYSASLAWSAPSDGGSAITSYKLYVYLDGVQLSSKTVSGITTTSYTLQNLLYNAGNYTFKVSAVNGVGEGSLSSASSNVRPTAISNGVSRSLNTDSTPTFSYLKDSNNNDIIFTKSSGKGWVANVYMSNLFGHPMYSTTKNRIIFKVEGLGFNGDKVVYLVYDRNIASTTNRYLYIKKDDLGQAQISTISPSNTNIEHLSIEYTSTDSLSLFLFNKNHTVLSQTIANASVLTQDYWHRAIYNVKVSVAIQYTSPTENDIFYNSLSYIK
jgi:predicted phage tail protein